MVAAIAQADEMLNPGEGFVCNGSQSCRWIYRLNRH